MEQSKKLLAGLKVVELATYVAAPTCSKLLADMGAEVIKIESPSGDPWRYGAEAPGQVCPRFEVCNSGKKSVVLNLKTPEGMDAIIKLIAAADIFVTNNRRKALQRLGLDHDTLRARFPKLIYAWLTGYGEKGPEADLPGFDAAAFWAKSGFMADMSVKTPAGYYPLNSPLGVGDTITGAMLYTSVLTALIRRAQTGEGDFVTTSLFNAGIWSACGMIAVQQHNTTHPLPAARSQCRPEGTTFQCADGQWIMMCILEYDRYAPAFYAALGYPGLLESSKFDTPQKRSLHNSELLDLASAAFARKTSDEWLRIMSDLDIVCTRVEHFADVPKIEQAWANDYLDRVQYPNGEEYIYPSPPFRLESQPLSRLSPAPRLGADTQAVLSALSDAQ